ncbi:ribosomal protein S18-alanine N-acetyltransferase [Conservatibacter flavescens]|uniref:[Ribosomal protein bS18]-alanine N-acetyltransferase n=1 Tax=Conservatibacter flavescens TaxID=28161 RepID=A0A2M8S008_9PAST|nr:ribosomal protein S18-alanine N-acetyltransferase [Conservatibacter flavescens]PJG84482.1 ribosomal-protein-alanine N-acetyltransferase [Conservatibacter flavescens]
MHNIHILPVNPDDFDALYQIEQAAHETPWTMGTLKNNQGERYFNLKLVQQNQIVGFAICQLVLDEATLFNIAIAPQSQGQGFGKYLLQTLINTLREKNITTLWLEVRQSNQKAQCLYSTLGFNEVDIRKNYYPKSDGGRENAVVMALYL